MRLGIDPPPWQIIWPPFTLWILRNLCRTYMFIKKRSFLCLTCQHKYVFPFTWHKPFTVLPDVSYLAQVWHPAISDLISFLFSYPATVTEKKTAHTGKIIIWRLGTKYHGSQVLPRVDIQFHASVVKEWLGRREREMSSQLKK